MRTVRTLSAPRAAVKNFLQVASSLALLVVRVAGLQQVGDKREQYKAQEKPDHRFGSAVGGSCFLASMIWPARVHISHSGLSATKRTIVSP